MKVDGLIVDITDEDFAGDLGLKVILRGGASVFRRLADLFLSSKHLLLDATMSPGVLEVMRGSSALGFRVIAPGRLRLSLTAEAERDFYAMLERFAHPHQSGGHYFVDAEALGAPMNAAGLFEGEDFEIILDKTSD